MQQPRQQLYRKLLGASCATFAVFLFAFCLVPTLMSEASAAEDVRSAVSWSPVSLTLDPGFGDVTGDVEFEFVAPTSVEGSNKGTMRVVKKNIAVTTTGQYYSVYLSTGSSTSNNLDYNGDSNISIDAINGTWSSPASFSGNDWGYAVPGSPITSGFSSAATYSAIPTNTDITYASDQTHYNSGLWAAVPNSTTGAQQIWKATTVNPNGFGGEHGDTNNNFDVYYAAVANTRLIAGEYVNTLVYTAIASGGSLDNVSNNVGRSQQYVTGGDIETLTFDLAMSVPTLSKNQVHVYLVPHRNAELNKDTNGNYVVGANFAEAFANSTYECVIGNSADDFVLTSSTTSSTAKLNCVMPANPTGVNGGGASMNGEYDFWITVGTYNYNYISQYKTTSDTEIASVSYAGLHTTNRAGTDYVIKEMQQMSPSICKNTNRWGTGTGESATILDPNESRVGYTGSDPHYYEPGHIGAWPATFGLKDTRDNKTYLVRRLADGNCWMVQDLSLDLTTVGTLTAENTDLNSKTSWTPNLTTLTTQFADATTARYKENSSTGKKYYNGHAITAESLSSLAASSQTTDSICPKNWTLASDSQMTTLRTEYSLTYDTEHNLPISMSDNGGYYYPGSGCLKYETTEAFCYTDVAAIYWSGKLADNKKLILWDSASLSGDSGYIHIASYSNINGYTTRCIAR